MEPNALRGIADHVVIDPEVRDALDEGLPLVALESSPIAFGWERDRSLSVLSSSIAAIVDCGALPAVFWVEGGRIRASADLSTVGRLAGDRDVHRVSRGTLANSLLSGRIGATTISATMMMAHAVGIPTLAVGGIGGVHLGAFGPTPTLDVSPDIDELSRTPMIVVSSGPKIILDVPATLEMLETRGVPIVSIGTTYVPGYFVRVTERLAPITVADTQEAARLASKHLSLDTGTSILFGVPIPAEAGLAADEVAPVVEQAQRAIRKRGLSGGKVTSTILDALSRATSGRTKDALEAVTVSNAQKAAEIAAHLDPCVTGQ